MCAECSCFSFSVLLYSCQNSKYILTTVKTLTKCDDFIVSRFRITEYGLRNLLQNA
jgi:hypothetical protein